MTLGRVILATLFIAAGIMHFIATSMYARIVPPILPNPWLLVQISGLCEVLGGLGLLFPSTQKLAAWGLVALLIAVLPANIYMAIDHAAWPKIPVWALWVRVPLQLPIIWWAWLYARVNPPSL
jgi:uncharacterized membrane protein